MVKVMPERIIKFMQKSAPYWDKFRIILGGFCLAGAGVHLLDMLGLNGSFFEFPVAWQIGTVYLFLADIVASVGIFKKQGWGTTFFILGISITQLFCYSVFRSVFGEHNSLLVTHLLFLLGILYFTAADALVEHGEM